MPAVYSTALVIGCIRFEPGNVFFQSRFDVHGGFSVPEGLQNPSGTLELTLLLCFPFSLERRVAFCLRELPAFGFHKVLGMPLAIFRFPVITTQLALDDDLLPFLGQRGKVFSGFTPDDHVYESSDLLAFTSVVVEKLVASERSGTDRSSRHFALF